VEQGLRGVQLERFEAAKRTGILYCLSRSSAKARAAARDAFYAYCKRERLPWIVYGTKAATSSWGWVEFDLAPARRVLTDAAMDELHQLFQLYATKRSTMAFGPQYGAASKLPADSTSRFVARLHALVSRADATRPEPGMEPAAHHFPLQGDPMSVKLFRDETGYAMQTEAPNEVTFTSQFTQLLSDLIEQQTYAGHWRQVLKPWIEQAVNICCAYRGYKVEAVEQRTLYTTGKIGTSPQEPTHLIEDEPALLAQRLGGGNGQRRPLEDQEPLR
jgi:hypothetical protein